MSTVGESSLMAPTTLDDIEEVKPATWTNDTFPIENRSFVSEQQHLQSHMEFPSYFAENQSWTGSQRHSIMSSGGYPTTLMESPPTVLEPSAEHDLIQPKLEPYETSPRAHHHTIDLQDLDISAQTALFNVIRGHRRRATLIME
jgi:hypothetical protein